MKVGFDLDGTLDKPAIRNLAMALLRDGWEVHIITGVFTESNESMSAVAKREKLLRLQIPFDEEVGEVKMVYEGVSRQHRAHLHVLFAMPESYPRDYRLADLGLRKGELCERLGISIFIDDSDKYCEMIPKMSGATTVLHVRA